MMNQTFPFFPNVNVDIHVTLFLMMYEIIFTEGLVLGNYSIKKVVHTPFSHYPFKEIWTDQVLLI